MNTPSHSQAGEEQAEEPQLENVQPEDEQPEEEAPFAYTHSSGFPELLEQLGATLLVSTYQAGKLCAFRARDGRLYMVPRTFDRAMGIAADANRLAIATGYQVWFMQNEAILASRIEPAAKHDACYIPRTSHVTSNIDAHEIAWSGDELWIVNTHFSCLCTLDPSYSFVPRWTPNFITELVRRDRCHLNGLAMEQGRPRYVTALGESDTTEGWRENKKDGGCLIDVPSGEVVVRGFCMPHSPRVHDGRVWLLDSGNGRLVTVDVQSGRMDVIAELPGYPRGMALYDRYAFIGLSQIRETATFGGVPVAERSDNRKCCVWVVDITAGKIIEFIEFQQTVQEVFDVQLLPGIRFPALVGLEKQTIQRASVVGPQRPIDA
jgi:uncharacterized protein (TIGR03032 family)